MAKPDRRMTFRLTDAEAAVVENIRTAQPHLTKSDVVHLMFEDKREVVAAALRDAPVATRPAVRLDQAALAAIDRLAEAINENNAQLRQIRALENQQSRASNSGDPLIAGERARIGDLVEGSFRHIANIASSLSAVTSWRS